MGRGGKGADLNLLRDHDVRRDFEGANGNLDCALQVLAREGLDLLRPRGAEHQSLEENRVRECSQNELEERTHLAVGANLLDDLPQLRLEAHVEHPVRLIEDEVSDAPKVRLSRLEHVDQASGGSDDDLASALEVADLSSLGDSAVDAAVATTCQRMEILKGRWDERVADAGARSELGALLLDLDSELARRSEDEDDGAISGCHECLRVDVNLKCGEVGEERRQARGGGTHHGGESKRNRLPGSSSGDCDEVTSGKRARPSLALNRRGLFEPSAKDPSHDLRFSGSAATPRKRQGTHVVRKARFVEARDGVRDVVTKDLDPLLPAEHLDLGVAASGDSGVLDVEVYEGRQRRMTGSS